MKPKRIVLIGFMGAGKSSVGRIVAERLGWDFVDTDAFVEARAGARIAEIFRTSGEATFREWESRVIGELAARTRIVVATGGGAPTQPSLRSFFAGQDSTVVHLRVSLADALQRTGNHAGRPLLSQSEDAIRALYQGRQAIYEELGMPVETDGKTPLETAEQIMLLLGNPSR